MIANRATLAIPRNWLGRTACRAFDDGPCPCPGVVESHAELKIVLLPFADDMM